MSAYYPCDANQSANWDGFDCHSTCTICSTVAVTLEFKASPSDKFHSLENCQGYESCAAVITSSASDKNDGFSCHKTENGSIYNDLRCISLFSCNCKATPNQKSIVYRFSTLSVSTNMVLPTEDTRILRKAIAVIRGH
jgi:hypothetical protein